MLDNLVTSICWMIKEKVGIMLKPWQVSAMIDLIHNKKDIVISAGIRSDKSLLYQCISFIKYGAIVLIVLPTITLMTVQVYFYLLL